MIKPNIYELTARFYDFGNSREITRDDIDFYLQTFHKGQSVLDIGCGTGRVGIELAQAGIDVTGVDLSEQMLAIYREKISTGTLKGIRLQYGDMTNFDLGQTFDGIIFPFRVFQALQTDEDRVKCLACMQKHMTPDSIAVITMFNPNPEYLKSWGKRGIVDFDEYSEQDGCNIRRIQNQITADLEKQTIAVEMIYQKHVDGKVMEEYPDRIELGYLFPDQARRLFEGNGLVIQNVYGYYDRSEIKPGDFTEQIYMLKSNITPAIKYACTD